MEEKRFLTPAEIAEYTVTIAQTKASNTWGRLLILGIFAGVYIAFACVGSSMAAHNLISGPETYGLGRVLTGFIFGTGLMLVAVTGAELFTGNNLMVIGLLEKKITWRGMLRNWGIVYSANFLGAAAVAFLIFYSGLFNESAGAFGGMTIRTAASKTQMNFHEAFFLGILCNMLVCAAIWMGYGARDIVSKLFACFFPVWLFVTSNFEHSIANIYLVPAGILASSNQAWLSASGLDSVSIASLTWGNFLIKNLLPVTIGNIIGGALITGCSFWFCFMKKNAGKGAN